MSSVIFITDLVELIITGTVLGIKQDNAATYLDAVSNKIVNDGLGELRLNSLA